MLCRVCSVFLLSTHAFGFHGTIIRQGKMKSLGHMDRRDTRLDAGTDTQEISVSLLPDYELESDALSLDETALYYIRHGKSVSNEWMEKPENSWGASSYDDNSGNVRDSPLSDAGKAQAVALRKNLLGGHWIDSIELVVVSPLTRCLQTFDLAVKPVLPPGIAVLALPQVCERLYTVSEAGRHKEELQSEYPEVDFSNVVGTWWYDPSVPTSFNKNTVWKEWRPSNESQSYGVPGEPDEVFEARMEALKQWLHTRAEKRILVVAHWGVFCHLTETQMQNCQVKRMNLAIARTAATRE